MSVERLGPGGAEYEAIFTGRLQQPLEPTVNPAPLKAWQDMDPPAAEPLGEQSAGDLATLAAILAGPGASDGEIVGQFGRASVLLGLAGEWLACDIQRKNAEFAHLLNVATQADANDPLLPWDDPALHKISGYDGADYSKRDLKERGQLLWDNVRHAVGRTFGPVAAQALREKYRDGIEASRLERLWPQLSKYRRTTAGDSR